MPWLYEVLPLKPLLLRLFAAFKRGPSAPFFMSRAIPLLTTADAVCRC